MSMYGPTAMEARSTTIMAKNIEVSQKINSFISLVLHEIRVAAELGKGSIEYVFPEDMLLKKEAVMILEKLGYTLEQASVCYHKIISWY